MPNKMLIDASHPEETRVVVVRGSRIEEFDFESQDKKQLKGNIYLARVTRVEPSLQAAFVEYGGNRHGFLAFSEIHPDYYQIPVADRQALLRAEAEAAEDDDEDGESEERQKRGGNRRRRRGGRSRDRNGEAQAADAASDEAAPEAQTAEGDDASDAGAADASDDQDGGTVIAAAVEADVVSEEVVAQPAADADADGGAAGHIEEIQVAGAEEHEVESVGAEDALEEARNRRRPVRRHYKIQEVIKRRQILLVQVVKEERGNKGAALTTYLSLAGRYSVLMPNTARGGGISRKITSAQDRKRLKEVVADLDVPQGMGVILRTAGESRTKAEIKRDYEYLMRMWETVRNLTLESIAPALVYEEGSLIKRSVRDLYNKDIDEILVSGEDGYREAKDFMRMLMPSHAKVVQPYRETTPIFVRSGIEAQLDKMLQPQVTLKSGGYIIINQTEALVSIDVNSGRSTREHSIEDTALHTNLEAAEEVARQLRLRDLAGLIVIDFIDMEENRNNRSVEKRLKDHLKNDRARIQVGRISHFGLMEMSRQRIRASVLESTMKPCPHCGGTGHVRSDSSVALLVVRAIEEFLLKDSRHHITVRTPSSTALYVLNHKRGTLAELEARFGLSITVEVDEAMGAQHYAIFRGAVAEKPAGLPEIAAPVYDDPEDEDVVEEPDSDEPAAEAAERPAQRHDDNGENGQRKRRRRRRRRGGRDRDEHREQAASVEAVAEDAADGDDEDDAAAQAAVEEGSAPVEDDQAAKKRRRGKRGGKRNRRDGVEGDEASAEADAAAEADVAIEEPAPAVDAPADEPVAEEKPKKRRASRSKKVAAAETEAEVAEAAAPAEPVAEAPIAIPADEAEPARPSRRRASSGSTEPVVSSVVPDQAATTEEKPKKAGWWQRRSFF